MSEHHHEHDHAPGCAHAVAVTTIDRIAGDQQRIQQTCRDCNTILSIKIEGCPHPTNVFLYFDGIPSNLCLKCITFVPLEDPSAVPYGIYPPQRTEMDQSEWVKIGVERGWMRVSGG